MQTLDRDERVWTPLVSRRSVTTARVPATEVRRPRVSGAALTDGVPPMPGVA
jgi:hypothetical protein